MRELKQSILKGIISILLVVITRILDVFVFAGATEALWFACGYIIYWIWEIEEG